MDGLYVVNAGPSTGARTAGEVTGSSMTEQRPDIAEQRARLMDGLRTYGAAFNQFSRRFARRADLHATDGEALMEIVYAEERGEPLTPSRLADRVQLTSGATTSLIDRLERGGYVVRTREGPDRRSVTLRSGSNVHEMADEFFRPLAQRLDVMMAQHPPELLAQFEAFLDELHQTMQTQLDEHP